MSADQLELALDLAQGSGRRVEHASAHEPHLWEFPDAVPTRGDLARLLRPVSTVTVTGGGWL